MVLQIFVETSPFRRLASTDLNEQNLRVLIAPFGMPGVVDRHLTSSMTTASSLEDWRRLWGFIPSNEFEAKMVAVTVASPSKQTIFCPVGCLATVAGGSDCKTDCIVDLAKKWFEWDVHERFSSYSVASDMDSESQYRSSEFLLRQRYDIAPNTGCYDWLQRLVDEWSRPEQRPASMPSSLSNVDLPSGEK